MNTAESRAEDRPSSAPLAVTQLRKFQQYAASTPAVHQTIRSRASVARRPQGNRPSGVRDARPAGSSAAHVRRSAGPLRVACTRLARAQPVGQTAPLRRLVIARLPSPIGPMNTCGRVRASAPSLRRPSAYRQTALLKLRQRSPAVPAHVASSPSSALRRS